MNGEGYIPLEDHGVRPRQRDHPASRREREDRRERERERGGDRAERIERERERDRERDGHRERGERGDRRHRSRSPPRRRVETDTYSSSRDHREREREDRYRRDDRRDDRWERGDRTRRDNRFHDEGPRRDRDHGDDRRGGPISRRGRGGDRDRDRDRTASPPRAPREPTPDLTGVVAATQRKRRQTNWDTKPANYENITAEQAKLSGLFPLPGAPRQPAMDMSRLQALRDSAGSASAEALKITNARQSKRIFVENLPAETTEESVVELFNTLMNGLNVVKNENPCVSAKLSENPPLCALEFKTPEEATVALAFDGISVAAPEGSGNANGHTNGSDRQLVVRRPDNYIIASAPPEVGRVNGADPNHVPDSPNKILITNLPTALSEEDVIELISAFGSVKSFVLAKHTETGQSRGFAFCEYEDPDVTTTACEGLTNMPLGESLMKVQRALVGAQLPANIEPTTQNLPTLVASNSNHQPKSRVIKLIRMVTARDLADMEEYQDMCDDMRTECSKYGRILGLKIPRQSGARQNHGVGNVYIKYDSIETAEKAMHALAGRTFNGRTVVVSFFAEDCFDTEAW